MKMHKLECPNCHASLDPIEGLSEFWCPYCRGKVIVDDMSDKYYDTKVRMEEMDHVERMKDKEYEDAEKQRHDEMKVMLVIVLLLIFCVITALIMSLISN